MYARRTDTVGSTLQHLDDFAAHVFFGFVDDTHAEPVAGGGFFDKEGFAAQLRKPVTQPAERVDSDVRKRGLRGNAGRFQLSNDVRIHLLLDADDFIAQLQLHFFEALLGKFIKTVELDLFIEFAMLLAHGFQPFYQQKIFVHGSECPYVFDLSKNMGIIAKKWLYAQFFYTKLTLGHYIIAPALF